MSHIFEDETGAYDVTILWKIAPKAKVVRTTRLKGLNECVWGEKLPTPRELLKKQKDEEHWTRVLTADLRYPIIVTPERYIADGYHRVIKALFKGKKRVRARIFTSHEEMKPALIKK